MDSSSLSSAKEAFEKSAHILIVTPAQPENETAASAIALEHWVESQGKKATRLAPLFDRNDKVQFLKKQPQVLADPFEKTNPDLIIAVGVPTARDFTHLTGPLPDKQTPTISIDHRPFNDGHGTISLVDPEATSSAEIIYRLIAHVDPDSLTPPTATALLAGMIIATKSFRSSRVTPRVLSYASELVKQGADRETIIHELYRTRSLSTLKLWGRALARLTSDPSIGLVSTSITTEDFLISKATKGDIDGIISELIANSPEAAIILVTHESEPGAKNDRVHAIVQSERSHPAHELAKIFQPSGDQSEARFHLDNIDAAAAETLIASELKKRAFALSNQMSFDLK